jgi:hypothetical protein
MPEPDLKLCSLLRIQNTAQRSFYFICKTHGWTSPRCYDEEDRQTFLNRHAINVRPPPPESSQLRVWRRTRERMEARDRERRLEQERERLMGAL